MSLIDRKSTSGSARNSQSSLHRTSVNPLAAIRASTSKRGADDNGLVHSAQSRAGRSQPAITLLLMLPVRTAAY